MTAEIASDVDEAVRALVASAPPFNAQQRAVLAGIFGGVN